MKDLWKGASRWRRGAVAIAGANFLGQAMIALTAPVLSRIYGPTDFGVFTTAAAFLAIVGVVAALRFDMAVPLPNDEEEAYALVYLGLVFSVLIGILAFIFFVLFGQRLSESLGQPGLWPWILVVPPAITFGGSVLTLNQLAIRQARFNSVAQGNLIRALAGVTAQILVGLTRFKTGGLIVGVAFGQGLNTLSLLTTARFRSQSGRRGLQLRLMARTARRYKRFPIQLAPSAILNVAGLQVPILLIAYFYTAEVTGWLGLTQRVLILPVAVIGGAVMQVYSGRLAEMIREGGYSLSPLYTSTSKRLLRISILPVAILLMFGPSLFDFVFGENWIRSGEYARAFSLVLGAQIVAVPVSSTLILLERTRVQLVWDGTRFIACCLAVSVPAVLGLGDMIAVWSLGITSTLAYALIWHLGFAHVKRLDTSPSR